MNNWIKFWLIVDRVVYIIAVFTIILTLFCCLKYLKG